MDDTIQVQLNEDKPIPLQVDFTSRKGEIFIIVGPSGSGKTTILRSIAGLYKPKQGQIHCHGHDWLHTAKNIAIPVQKRRVGMVFQHYALFPHLNVMENIAIALSHIAKDKWRDRINGLLNTVNMEGLGERYPHQLSGGQQQRVAVARALARDPEVLLLDEPFSAVDKQTRKKLLRELASLKKQLSIPVILVTHDLEEARMLADKICVIHHGSTLQIDVPETIMTRPVSAVVAKLVGLENVFSGTIVRHDADAKITYLQWHDYTFETPYQPQWQPGTEIDWVIPSENLILHRRDRPSRGERENPITGKIKEFIPLGESATVTIEVNGKPDIVSMTVPTHVARRNNLDNGGEVSVSLLAEGIHIMEKA